MKCKKLLLLFTVVLLLSCKANDLQLDEEKSFGKQPRSAAKALSDDRFNLFSNEQQFQIANKLSSTFYKGVPLGEFFDLRENSSVLKIGGGKDFLSKTRTALNKRVDNIEGYNNLIELRYILDEERQHVVRPLATIREFPISRDMFEAWMAYTLANTILFSPAEEIDSASYVDIQKVFTGLTEAMKNDVSIRKIIYTHMVSTANWRRFRSPEDNTREMIEIYLGLFDRDEDVPKASLACKNWYITEDDGNYELIKDSLSVNTEPQFVLDQWVTTCEDFYTVVAEHPLVTARIVTYIVDRFFAAYSAEDRAAITQDIVETNPVYFRDIFLHIIFSEEYLLNNERPKSFEETFFSVADRVGWKSDRDFLDDLARPDGGTPTLHKMKQPAMSLKLGRFKDQPLDSLSFAFYHSAVRERLLTGADNDWGRWGDEFVRQGDFYEQDDYIHYLFMSVISRKASNEELTTLKQVFVDTENEDNRSEQARIVFDYISRLPELYYSNAIAGVQ